MITDVMLSRETITLTAAPHQSAVTIIPKPRGARHGVLVDAHLIETMTLFCGAVVDGEVVTVPHPARIPFDTEAQLILRNGNEVPAHWTVTVEWIGPADPTQGGIQ